MAVAIPWIERESLHDSVLRTVRELIVSGTLYPDERISEPDLCARLRVSRTPLREALKVLAHENLVELLPGRGAKVAPILPSETAEVFEVLEGLELLAGELAVRRISDSELAVIVERHHAMRAAFEAGDVNEYFVLNQDIHDRIISATHNASLADIHAAASRKIYRARRFANEETERVAQSLAEHEQILAALTERDAARLSRLLREHVVNTRQAVLKALELLRRKADEQQDR